MLLQEKLTSQHEDLKCQHYAATIVLSKRPFDFNKDGLLVFHSSLDGEAQTVVEMTHRNRFICLSNTALRQEQVEETNNCHTLRRTFYWPFMAGDISSHVHACWSCARPRIAHVRNNKAEKYSHRLTARLNGYRFAWTPTEDEKRQPMHHRDDGLVQKNWQKQTLCRK